MNSADDRANRPGIRSNSSGRTRTAMSKTTAATRRQKTRHVPEGVDSQPRDVPREEEALRVSEERLRLANLELVQRVTDLDKMNSEARDSRRAALNLMEDAVKARQAIETLNKELRESEEALRGLNDKLEQRISELAQSEDRLRTLATELNLAEQRERKRLATELHDHLQQ